MNKWKQAIIAQDIDAIVEFYSEDFKSMDGNGKEGAQEVWTEIKELGYLEKIEINLETAKIEVDGKTAEIKIFNDEGEFEIGNLFFCDCLLPIANRQLNISNL